MTTTPPPPAPAPPAPTTPAAPTAVLAVPDGGAGPAVPVSVLDRGGHAPGAPGEQAVRELTQTARTADACGYHRFWVAEHHGTPNTASSFPAVLIAHLAAHTRRIRVGAGGVMLPNHAPYTVAEQFATLQALHPGRIDLGLGRPAPAGTAQQRLLQAALRRDPGAVGAFPELVDELLGFLHHHGPDRHRFHALPLTPHTTTPPEVHVLGAGEGSARIAAARGLPFAYGHHLSRTQCRPEAAARYRSAFQPAPGGPARRHLVVAVNVVCAASDAEAEEQAVGIAAERLGPAGSTSGAAPSPARVAYLARQLLAEFQVVHGAPGTVAARLGTLAADLGADEVMLAPFGLTGPARCRTLRLAAPALAPAAAHRAAVTVAAGG